jgi:hypothetical protein
MRFRLGLRFPAVPVFSAAVFASSALFMCASMSGVGRADSVKFVASDHGDPFDAAAAASVQSANLTMAQKPVEVAGLVIDGNPVAFGAPTASNRTYPSSTAIFSEPSSPSNFPRARSTENGAIAFDTSSHQDAASDSKAASESPATFDGVGGFFSYGGVPVSSGSAGEGQSLGAAGSKPIDLGIGRSGESVLNSTDGTTPRHHGVTRRIKWSLRMLTGEPVPVPEPSSRLLLGCGIFLLALKRRYGSAN